MESLRWAFAQLRNLPFRVLMGIVGVVLLLMLIYYPLGMLIVNRLDDNLEFSAGEFDPKGDEGSHSVAITIALLNREVVKHHWTPSDPFFMPGAALDRMPAYQKGIVSALSRFSVELMDQIGRTRGSSQPDQQLEAAAGMLKYGPEKFWFDFSVSIMPVASSESQYRGAMKSLIQYQDNLKAGKATFERRSDNLMATLERITMDLGSASAAIDNRVTETNRPWFDTDADVMYYDVKGRMYAYYLLLRELRKDYAQVIEEKKLGPAWDQTLHTLGEGARLRTFFVFNGAPDSQFIPNHLSAEGFYLLRARTQIQELSSILLH